MATIRPFRALRFSQSAGPIDELVAPPYDVLSPEERDAFAAKNPKNIVWITLPEQMPDDRSKFVKYGRSSARLAEWRREGQLAVEPGLGYYRYVQTFSIPGRQEPVTRTSFFALLKTEPYEKGVVLPHEETFPKHKEDRLRLMEATQAIVEPIYGLFEDDDGSGFDALASAPAELLATYDGPDGVSHRLELIADPEAVAALTRAMQDRRVWIADGHHRYETSRTYRESIGEKEGVVAEDFMLMALGSMADPGLVILPTHRIVKEMPLSPMKVDQALQTRFNTRRLPNEQLLSELNRLRADDTRVLGVAQPGGVGMLLCLEDPDLAARWVEGDNSPRYKKLDVTILHKVVFEKALGLTGQDFFSYTRDPEEALGATQSGAYAFLMNPPSVEDMKEIALGGEKMPQKSTYYYPKLLSGLVLWSFDLFEN